MKWWKAHHGIATDLKYAVLLRHIRITESNALRSVGNADETKCPVTRADILAVWVWLLDFASQNNPRGDITGVSRDEISTSLDLSDSTVDAIIDAFRWKGMVDGNLLTAFDKRQPCDDPTRNERQARFRQNRKQQSNALLSVTPLRNAVEPLCNENSLSVLKDVRTVVSNTTSPSFHQNSSSEEVSENSTHEKTDGSLTNGRNGNGHVKSQSAVVRPGSDLVQGSREHLMFVALHGYMCMSGTGMEKDFKPPDKAIIRKCLEAIGDADIDEVYGFLRERFDGGQQSPRHPSGPKSYGWFPKVLAERFGS